LRDQYGFYALSLDLGVLGLSTWLIAIAFVEPKLGIALTPPGIRPELWPGMLAIFTFSLSLIQLKVDWKGLSEAHRHPAKVFADVHREAGYLLSSARSVDEEENRRLLERYEIAATTGIGVPEKEFLRRKRRHLTKVAVSKYLDSHPSASILITRLKLWCRDNFHAGQKQ
jgi:hypothetical protein